MDTFGLRTEPLMQINIICGLYHRLKMCIRDSSCGDAISGAFEYFSRKALHLFYNSKVYALLLNKQYPLITLSDAYITDEIILELQQQ